jgi:hypothetical protein
MELQALYNEYLIKNNFEDLNSFEGLYKINKKGEIWSCLCNKIMKPQEKEGYLWLSLTKNGKKIKCYIHRLLAIQYIDNENPDTHIEIDHIDRNRNNNDLSNLRWVNKTIQNNNKSTNLSNKTEEQLEEKTKDLTEYKRKWAENKRRENGIAPREKIKMADMEKYKQEQYKKQREKRANMTEEERSQYLEKKRERYIDNAINEKQREYVNRPEVKEKRLEDQRKKREVIKLLRHLPFSIAEFKRYD